MSSTRCIAVLLCAVAIVGCKKKSAGSGSGGNAEPTASAAPADSASAAPSSSAAASDDAAPAAAAADEGGADAAAPTAAADDAAPANAADGATPPPDKGTTNAGGSSFTGTYACMGGLTLTQNGSGVRGSAITHQGNQTINYDITCAVSGNQCAGNAAKFVSKGGGPPKGAGGSRVVFKLASGGLDYTEGGVAGFCTRK